MEGIGKLRDFINLHILETVDKFKGDRIAAAKYLGISERTIRNRLKDKIAPTVDVEDQEIRDANIL